MTFWWSFWILSFKNLQRNFKRNIATGCAIGFGFSGLLFLEGYQYRLENYLRVYTIYTMHTGHFSIFAKNGLSQFNLKPKKYSLSLNQQEKIEKYLSSSPEIEFYEKQLSGQGLIGNGCLSLPFSAFGIEPLIDQKIKNHPEVKYWMSDLEFFKKGKGLWHYQGSQNPIGMTLGLARALGKLNVLDDIKSGSISLVDCKDPAVRTQFSEDANVQLMSGKWSGSIGVIDGEVVNHYTTGFEEGDHSAIQLNRVHLQNLYDTDKVELFAVWLKNPNDLTNTIQSLEKNLNDLDLEIRRWDDEELSPYYYGTTQFLGYLVSFIGVVLLTVIIFSVLNSVTMTVLERSQEIGMYRSIGFRRKHVNTLFLLETLWLCLLSLLSGGLLTSILVQLIHHAHIMYYPPGVVGGIPILISIKPHLVIKAGFFVLVFCMGVTYLTVQLRLKLKVADLVGGLFR